MSSLQNLQTSLVYFALCIRHFKRNTELSIGFPKPIKWTPLFLLIIFFFSFVPVVRFDKDGLYKPDIALSLSLSLIPLPYRHFSSCRHFSSHHHSRFSPSSRFLSPLTSPIVIVDDASLVHFVLFMRYPEPDTELSMIGRKERREWRPFIPS